MIELTPLITSFSHYGRRLNEETQLRMVNYARNERVKFPTDLPADESDFANMILSEKMNYKVCAQLTGLGNDGIEHSASVLKVSYVDIVEEYDYVKDHMIYALLLVTAWNRPFFCNVNGVRYYIFDADALNEDTDMRQVKTDDANLFIKREFSNSYYTRGQRACSVTYCIPIVSVPMDIRDLFCGYAITTSVDDEAHSAFEFLDMRCKDSKRLFELQLTQVCG